jgi:hypothetical protein
MRDVLDFLTFSKALGSSHNIHGRDLKSAFCQIRSKDKASIQKTVDSIQL